MLICNDNTNFDNDCFRLFVYHVKRPYDRFVVLHIELMFPNFDGIFRNKSLQNIRRLYSLFAGSVEIARMRKNSGAWTQRKIPFQAAKIVPFFCKRQESY